MWNVKYWNCTIKRHGVWSPTLMLFFWCCWCCFSCAPSVRCSAYSRGGWVYFFFLQMGLKTSIVWQTATDESSSFFFSFFLNSMFIKELCGVRTENFEWCKSKGWSDFVMGRQKSCFFNDYSFMLLLICIWFFLVSECLSICVDALLWEYGCIRTFRPSWVQW